MVAYPKGSRVFVDECKTKGYYFAAAAVMPNDVGTLDKALRKLARPGQRRIHFKDESDSSRRRIIAEVCKMHVSVVVYQVKGEPDKIARPMCLNALVDDVAMGGCERVILERDDSLEQNDRRLIAAALRRNGSYPLMYEHASPYDHAALWISDMVAWCCFRGGDWRRRVDGIVVNTRELRH